MTDAVLPASRIVRVTFEVALPVAATRDQVEEWIDFALGAGSMAANPLQDYDVESLNGLGLTDTGNHARFIVSDLEEIEGGYRYRLAVRASDSPTEHTSARDAISAAIAAFNPGGGVSISPKQPKEQRL